MNHAFLEKRLFINLHLASGTESYYAKIPLGIQETSRGD